MKSSEIKNSQETSVQFLSFFNKRRVRIGVTLLVCLAVLAFSLPVAGKWYLKYWLKENGADEVTISTLFLNPFTERISLEGVDIIDGERSLLSSLKFNIKVDFFSLFKKEVRVVQAHYEQLKIYLQQHEDGRWTIASYTTPGDKTIETGVVSDEVAEDDGGDWAIRVDELTIDNCIINIVTPKISSEIVIEQAAVENFSTREGAEPAQLSIKGQLSSIPIQIDLATLSVFPDLTLAGLVDVQKFDTRLALPFLEDILKELEGFVSLKGKVDFDASAEVPVFSYNGDLLVEDGKIATDDVVVIAEKIAYQGEVGNKDNETNLVFDGLLQAEKIAYQVPGDALVIRNQQLDLDGHIDIGIGSEFSLASNFDVSSSKLKLKMGGIGYDHQKISWQGSIKNSSNSLYVLNGGLTIGGLGFSNEGIQVDTDEISIVGETSVNVDGQVVVTSGANIKGASLSLMLPDNSYKHETIAWNGEITYSTKLARADGKLRLKGVDCLVEAAGESFKSSLTEFVWNGSTSYAFTETDLFSALLLNGSLDTSVIDINVPGATPVAISLESLGINSILVGKEGVSLGVVDLSGVKLFSTLAQRSIFDVADVTVSSLIVTTDMSVKAQQADFQALHFFPSVAEAQHSAKLNQLKFYNFIYSKHGGVGFSKIAGNDLAISLIRDDAGSFNWARHLDSISKKTTVDGADSPKSEKADSNFPIKIDLVEFTGENLVHFTDHTLAIPFETDVVLQKIFVENIDTSGAGEGINVNISAQLEGRAPLSIAGSLQPFGTDEKKDNSAKLDFKLRNYPLANLSPYLIQSVGTGIESGQLKLTGSFVLNNNVLDVKNDLLIKKLKTKAISPALAKQLDNKLPLPLEAALDLLEDSNDNISLSVPIKGTLGEIDLDLSDAFVTALSKAIVPAASSYLMYALGPYGALAYVAVKLGENILQIELPPVEFQAGEKDLTPEHIDYLKRIGLLLNDEKSTNDMQICPVVNIVTELGVEGDFVVDDLSDQEREELQDLGQQRASMVRDYLANEEGVEEDRLLLCITRLVKNEESRVELQPEQ